MARLLFLKISCSDLFLFLCMPPSPANGTREAEEGLSQGLASIALVALKGSLLQSPG